MPHVFTSIGYAVERLHECEHFLCRLAESRGQTYGFELNAFLSASRSVTFVLQKSMARTPGFDDWYKERRMEMTADSSMRFFLELRNVSQKQGPVAYVGGATGNGRWTYQFASGAVAVPPELFGRDIVDCCAEQLRKLSQLLLSYYIAYPAHACVSRAWTEEGMNVLGFSLGDVAFCLGLPEDYLAIGDKTIPQTDMLRILQREIDAVDENDLKRLTAGRFGTDGTLLEVSTGWRDGLVTDLARLFETRSETDQPRSLMIRAIAQRISDVEKK